MTTKVVSTEVSDWCSFYNSLNPGESSDGLQDDSDIKLSLTLVLIKASWNKLTDRDVRQRSVCDPLADALQTAANGFDFNLYCNEVTVDTTEDSLAQFIGETDNDYDKINNNINSSNKINSLQLPCPPEELPALALLITDGSNNQQIWEYLPIKSAELQLFLCQKFPPVNLLHTSSVYTTILQAIDRYSDQYDWPVTAATNNPTNNIYSLEPALRIFVAGDRASVGKSSICLGLLSALMQQSNFSTLELGYIKPATQSEKPQLVELYCKRHNIRNVPVGPLVYYRGFTRAFLAGETENSLYLLQQCARAVDRVARNKRVVIVDGVGFPAVGSICGTDNAQVALACSGRNIKLGVVVVGGPGVGAAVDAYNLNAMYFKQAGVPVLGPIFNKLTDDDSFYSLEQCREQISKYFALYADEIRPFGFVPIVDNLSTLSDADHFTSLFNKHVDVSQILQAVRNINDKTASRNNFDNNGLSIPSSKRQRIGSISKKERRSRQEIEQAATVRGARKSA